MRSLLRTGLLLLPLLAAGCDHIEYHPYDTDISGEQNINAKNIARIEAACRGRQTVRFAMISDTQRWYDETEKAVEALNARDDIDFVLHGGDLSDFGLKKEFMWQRDILNRLRVPYVCLLGNPTARVRAKRCSRRFSDRPTSHSRPPTCASSV